MGVYMGQGLRRARRTGVLLEFTDSFYYLGFTLTIISLLYSANIFGGGPRPYSAHDILRYYGVGLAATVLGVVGRNAAQLFYLSGDETAEAAAKQIAQQTQEFVATLESLNARLSSMVAETFSTLHNHVQRTLGDIDTELKDLAGKLGRFSSALGSVKLDPTNVSEAFQEIRAGAKGAAAAFESAVAQFQALEQRLGTSVGELERVLKGLEGLQSASESAGSALRTLVDQSSGGQVTAFREALGGAAAQLRALQETIADTAWKDIAQSAKLLAASLKTAQTNVSKLNVAGLSVALNDGQTAIQKFKESLAGHPLAKFATEVDGACDGIVRFKHAVTGIVSALDGVTGNEADSISALKAALRETAKHVEALKEAMKEIAEAVKVKIREW
jgi:chromosome segregation ATPase